MPDTASSEKYRTSNYKRHLVEHLHCDKNHLLSGLCYSDIPNQLFIPRYASKSTLEP